MEENKPINSPDDATPPNNEQQLNTPSTDKPIVTTAETTTEVEQPSTPNLKPLNPDMEVHHHAHDPAAPHHQKN